MEPATYQKRTRCSCPKAKTGYNKTSGILRIEWVHSGNTVTERDSSAANIAKNAKNNKSLSAGTAAAVQ
jgi:hypothetical protein